MVKKNKDMEIQFKKMQDLITKRFKRSLWDRVKDAMGVFFMACAILLCIAVVILLIVILIKNPLSLAVICGTILLIWMWGNR